MTSRNAYPVVVDTAPFESILNQAAEEAQVVDDPLIKELSDKIGAPLMRLDGYQTTYVYTEDELQAVEAAGIPMASQQLPRLQTGVNGTLWRATDLRTRYWSERKYELHEEVDTLTEAARGVIWVPTAPEYHIGEAIAARAPQGSDSYWAVGEPIKICRRYSSDDIENYLNRGIKHAYEQLDWGTQKQIQEDGYWDAPEYLLHPIQYFESKGVTYPESPEGEIKKSVTKVLADPHYENSGHNNKEVAFDNALMDVIFRAEQLGVDGLQFVQHLKSEKRRSTTTVKIGVSRQDADVIAQGVAEGKTIPADDQKRNNHFRNLVKLIAPFDADLATTVTDHIRKSSVKALAFVDISKTVGPDKEQDFLERAKQVVLDDPARGRGTALGRVFDATVEQNEEFARTLLPIMSAVTRSRCEAVLEELRQNAAEDKLLGSQEVASVPGQERELTIAEALLEEYRENGDHETLVKALAAGGLVKDIWRRQQLFNEIADQLTDVSLPSST